MNGLNNLIIFLLCILFAEPEKYKSFAETMWLRYAPRPRNYTRDRSLFFLVSLIVGTKYRKVMTNRGK